MDYKQGDIVEVLVPDPSGSNHKHRPVIILTSTTEITSAEPIVGVAISTNVRDPLPECHVELPVNHPQIALRKRCAAKCDWCVEFSLSDVSKLIGKLPARHMTEVMWQVIKLKSIL